VSDAIGFPDDPTVLALLGVVRDDPSDPNLLVLADRLQELGHPRGELIALQIERAHTGARPTTREVELIERHARGWLGPLAGAITNFTFRRGFLATATLDAGARPSAEDASPLWTVEELETRDVDLIVSPELRALRRLAVESAVFAALTRQPRATPLHTVVGPTGFVGGPATRRMHLGIAPACDELDLHTRALPQLRAMSLSVETPDDLAETLRFLESPLGDRLDVVELFAASLPYVADAPWRRVDELRRRTTLVLRSIAADWTVVLARHAEQLVVQLGDAQSPTSPDLHNLMPVLQSLGHGFDTVRLELVGAVPQVDLGGVHDQLRAEFPSLVHGASATWLSP
jgi:uncharacterized protein (TIGR02996 family)